MEPGNINELNRLYYCTPVCFTCDSHNEENLDYQSVGYKIVQAIDSYFKPNETYTCAYVTASLGDRQFHVVTDTHTQSATEYWLKRISYITVIVPLVMLVAQVIFRSCYSFYMEPFDEDFDDVASVHDDLESSPELPADADAELHEPQINDAEWKEQFKQHMVDAQGYVMAEQNLNSLFDQNVDAIKNAWKKLRNHKELTEEEGTIISKEQDSPVFTLTCCPNVTFQVGDGKEFELYEKGIQAQAIIEKLDLTHIFIPKREKITFDLDGTETTIVITSRSPEERNSASRQQELLEFAHSDEELKPIVQIYLQELFAFIKASGYEMSLNEIALLPSGISLVDLKSLDLKKQKENPNNWQNCALIFLRECLFEDQFHIVEAALASDAAVAESSINWKKDLIAANQAFDEFLAEKGIVTGREPVVLTQKQESQLSKEERYFAKLLLSQINTNLKREGDLSIRSRRNFMMSPKFALDHIEDKGIELTEDPIKIINNIGIKLKDMGVLHQYPENGNGYVKA